VMGTHDGGVRWVGSGPGFCSRDVRSGWLTREITQLTRAQECARHTFAGSAEKRS